MFVWYHDKFDKKLATLVSTKSQCHHDFVQSTMIPVVNILTFMQGNN